MQELNTCRHGTWARQALCVVSMWHTHKINERLVLRRRGIRRGSCDIDWAVYAGTCVLARDGNAIASTKGRFPEQSYPGFPGQIAKDNASN